MSRLGLSERAATRGTTQWIQEAGRAACVQGCVCAQSERVIWSAPNSEIDSISGDGQFAKACQFSKNCTPHANAIVRFICCRKSCAISPKMPQTEHNTTTTDRVKLQQTEDGACLIGVVGTTTMKRCRMRIAPLSAGGFERRDERAAGAHRPPRRGGIQGGAGQAAFQPVPQPQPKWQPQLRRVSSAAGHRSGVVAAAPLPHVLNFCLHILGIRKSDPPPTTKFWQ